MKLLSTARQPDSHPPPALGHDKTMVLPECLPMMNRCEIPARIARLVSSIPAYHGAHRAGSREKPSFNLADPNR